MTHRIARTVVLVALLLGASRAAAQVIVFGEDGEHIVFDGEGMETPPAPDAPNAADAGKAAKPSPRLEKLKKLEFDRRPSAMLEAWSKPPKPKEEPKKDEAKTGAAAVEATKPGETQAGSARPDAAQPGATLPSATASSATAPSATAPSAAAPSTTQPAASAPTVPATPAGGAQQPAAVTPADAEAAAKSAAEAEAKKAAEAETKRKADEEAAKKAAETKAIDEEMAALQRNVTLGEWAAVEAYFATLTEDERKGGYEQLLKSLQKGHSKKPQVPPQGQPYLEKNRFGASDVVALARTSPKDLTKENLALLGQILKSALDQGHRIEGFLALVRPTLDEAGAALDRRKLAHVLVAAAQPLEIGEFLPSLEEAEAKADREALNLLARHYLAMNDKEAKVEWLEKAWRTTQAALAAGEVSEEAKNEALARAVELAPKVRRDLGQAWLDESFTARPERGIEIVASIGSAASTALQLFPVDSDRRLRMLELQTTAANALIAAAPERADAWREHLALLAGNWLKEAQVTYQFDTSTTLGPQMQRDVYGNFYWWNEEQQMRGNVKAIPTGKLLDARPTDAWLARIDDTQLPRFRALFAQLYLKVSEDAEAFPYIESLARTHPRPAKDLADEFLRVWAKNHDPNGATRRQNPYIYFYGFEERANGIPLTRSKQERNLAELGEWVGRLRELGLEVDSDLVANAFQTAHSTAEVYRLETIEQIFGSMDALDAKLVARLLERMRANLATVWRDAAVQKDKKTNRRQQDIQAEVKRGYELARSTLERALEKHPDAWQLVLAAAAFEHDENDFEKELGKDPQYAERRANAFASFARAAERYASTVETLEREDESCEPYLTWFYAALGACDLRAIDHEKTLAKAEIAKVRAALTSLPAARAERHMEVFVNALTTRMSTVAPAVKARYAREGLAICGEHKLAREVRDVHAYYADLVTEIQLRATVDGDGRVGHREPFGLAIDLVHTKEIEREAGGFAKYLQNQNSAGFSWNYGRPTEDYRDKFEEAARTALKEHFEVLSVTFNEPQARSKATERYGWRVTPYAYLLLKPRGPEVDTVPPLQLDLDFLDTSGYAVLPIESSAVPIVALDERGAERPFEKLALTQTLDERQAKDGKLLLEVKASAEGLVPPLASLLDVAPDGFDVARVDDQGVSVVKFAEDGDGVTSERTWTLTLKAKEGLTELPQTFAFAAPKVETTTNERFRYVDADLASVEPVVSLERTYGEPRGTWGYWLAALACVAGAAWWSLRRKGSAEIVATQRYRVPEPATPFNVLGLLRDIERNDGLAPEAKVALAREIDVLERQFFGDESDERADLRRVAESWVVRAR